MRAKNEFRFLAEAYDTKLLIEKAVNGVLMCSKDCCGSPVMECKCGDDCPHCNCFMIQKAVKDFGLKDKLLKENWEKGTSKAPKGKSFDMSRGGAPSNVDAARDGSGGRYRRTRPPSAPSKKTHGEMEEDRTTALIPKGGTLEDFLRSLEGKTIKQILDDNSYMSLYMSNKHGIGGQREGSDRDAMDFANKLVQFVNRDIGKKRPKEREYETEEFKRENDYDSYREARYNKTKLSMDRNKARREGKEDEMNKLNDEIDKLEDFMSNHPYQRGMRMIEKEYDKAVKDYHNTPLTVEYLLDSSSDRYDDLVAAYAKLGGQSETVIDV